MEETKAYHLKLKIFNEEFRNLEIKYVNSGILGLMDTFLGDNTLSLILFFYIFGETLNTWIPLTIQYPYKKEESKKEINDEELEKIKNFKEFKKYLIKMLKEAANNNVYEFMYDFYSENGINKIDKDDKKDYLLIKQKVLNYKNNKGKLINPELKTGTIAASLLALSFIIGSYELILLSTGLLYSSSSDYMNRKNKLKIINKRLQNLNTYDQVDKLNEEMSLVRTNN